MKNLIYLLSFLVFKLTAQTISPQVINSAGNSNTVSISGTNYFVAYNIGEPIVTTVGSGTNIVTQGFLQPKVASEFGLVIQTRIENEICVDKKNGAIYIDSISGPSNSYLKYYWYFNGNDICPTHNCSSMDSLAPGAYYISVVVINNSTGFPLDSISYSLQILKSDEACNISIYNAFSPDGNSINDNWIIKGITDFPNNVVTIYNRWGVELKRILNYDNVTKVWDGNTINGNLVTSGTYFYVIELGDNTKPLKGWVEVTGR